MLAVLLGSLILAADPLPTPIFAEPIPSPIFHRIPTPHFAPRSAWLAYPIARAEADACGDMFIVISTAECVPCKALKRRIDELRAAGQVAIPTCEMEWPRETSLILKTLGRVPTAFPTAVRFRRSNGQWLRQSMSGNPSALSLLNATGG